MPTPIKKRKIELDMDFREKIFDNLKTFYEMELLCNITLIAGIDQQRYAMGRDFKFLSLHNVLTLN